MGNTNWYKRHQLTIYKRGRGVELCLHFVGFYYFLLKHLIVNEVTVIK